MSRYTGRRAANQGRDTRPWCRLTEDGATVAVQFGAGDEPSFFARLEGLKLAIPADGRWWDADTRTWLVDAEYRPALLAWAARWFAPDRIQRGRPSGDQATAGGAHVTAPSTRRLDAAYAALWLLPGAPPEVVKAAYRALAIKCHPDVGGDTETMKQLNSAYESLMAREAA